MGSRGNRGDTQRQPYDNEHGRPLSMLFRRATGRYKETKFCRVVSGGENDAGSGVGGAGAAGFGRDVFMREGLPSLICL
jgi:hypothetical protein